MKTKLDAINQMLSCIGQAPLNTLEGTQSYFTISALQILEDMSESCQLEGWDFNTDEDYELKPDNNNYIHINNDMLSVKVATLYKNRYTIRGSKVYDKYNHTFKITEPIRAKVIFKLDFEDLPQAAKNYVTISAAYKFIKRELGTKESALYTQEDVIQARITLMEYESDIGSYTMIPEMYNGTIQRSI